MTTDHDRRPECVAELATLTARMDAILETQRRQNGQLAVVAEKLVEVRVSLAEKLGEIEAELRQFQVHEEQFEADLVAYRARREEVERESTKQARAAIAALAPNPVTSVLGISLWKFLLMLIGLVVILGAGIEGARWFMSRGSGIPAQQLRPAPAVMPTPAPRPTPEATQ